VIEAHRTIQLPDNLCKAAEAQFLGSDFSDLESLLVFILQELTEGDDQKLDNQDEQIIEERLRDLGYL